MPVAVHGERKQATLLFADIDGSTKLIAGLDLESAIGRLQPVVAEMARSVKRFDGTVLRTLGDGLKAAFGAPQAREGHALLACRAALAMQNAVAALPNPTSIRIGLHSGEVLTGALDTGASVEPEAQGMTVHIANRVGQEAEPGGICLTAQCRELVSGYCDTVSIGVRALKGLPAPVEVFRLTGMKPAIASEQFRHRSLARLCGRHTELATLQQALRNAKRGMASVIGVVAPAGVGKSRLCYEFSEGCRAKQVNVLEARGHLYAGATPLLPIIEMLRGFLRVPPGLEPEVARLKIEQYCASLDPTLVADAPVLADFLGLPADDSAGPRTDLKTRNVRLRDFISRMIKAIGRQPTAIIFEDLHWIDAPSQDLLETIVEAVRDTNIVLVLNYRPEWRSPWVEMPHYREVTLSELDAAGTLELVGALLGSDPALDPVVDYIARQCDGNPFFAEELVRVLAQDGVLTGARGQYGLAPSGWRDPALPETVEAVIGARLDRLPESGKAVLQIGSVIGKDFSVAVAHKVARLEEQALKDLCERLCTLDLIQPTVTVNGAGYTFRHPLIQTVAYAMQLRARRARLHAAVADALEDLPWGGLEEAASMLAHHRDAAGQPVEAAFHLRRAALWIGRTNPVQAMNNWKKIRELLLDQPRSAKTDELRALASGRVLGFAWSVGLSAADVRPYAEEALRFAREAGDLKHEALLTGAFGRVFAASDAADEYVALARQGVARAAASADTGVFVACNGHLTQAYFFAGLLRQSMTTNDTALDAQQRPNNGLVLGLNASQIFGFDVPQWLLCLRIRTLVLMGRFQEAEADLARALQADPAIVTPVVQYLAHMAAVIMAWQRNDGSMARQHATDLATLADHSGQPYLRVAALSAWGLTLFAEGDFDQATDFFQEALALGRKSRTGLEVEAKIVASLADAYDRGGDFAQAAKVAAEAIEIARRRTDRVAELHASIVAARTLSAWEPAERRSEIMELLGRAEHLLKVTGADVFRLALRRIAEEATDRGLAVEQ